MTDKLPTKLLKEPLMDAVFEVRFSMILPGSSILPGIFFEKLEGDKNIEPLPVMNIPKQMRDVDPNLKFAPLIRIFWTEFILLVGDSSVAVACKLPYPGWAAFKQTILRVIEILARVAMITDVKRYSLKYVDIIPSKDLREQVNAVELSVRIGDHQLEKDVFQLRIEILKDGFTNVVQIISAARGVTPDQKVAREGLVIDIDTICNITDITMGSMRNGLAEKLDRIHDINKAMFFKCLKPATLNDLEPIYE